MFQYQSLRYKDGKMNIKVRNSVIQTRSLHRKYKSIYTIIILINNGKVVLYQKNQNKVSASWYEQPNNKL